MFYTISTPHQIAKFMLYTKLSQYKVMDQRNEYGWNTSKARVPNVFGTWEELYKPYFDPVEWPDHQETQDPLGTQVPQTQQDPQIQQVPQTQEDQQIQQPSQPMASGGKRKHKKKEIVLGASASTSASATGPSRNTLKWTSIEQQALARSWIAVSEDPTVGKNLNFKYFLFIFYK